MAAPHLESTTSISSSGRTDGLGRRELAFDRETGDMLERLHARPEVALFEAVITDRIEQLAGFHDPRFARVRTAERVDGALTVLSDFIPGQTLADLFEAARDLSIVPGLDAALGYLAEGLYAVAALHRATGCAHGLIAPERTLFTADGRLVFLDAPYATAIERLALSRRRLWSEFGIRCPPGGSPSLQPLADISQVALGTVMLILGRRLAFDDVERLESLMPDVAEVASIRGSVAFATDLQRHLERLLPLQGHEPYASADEAIADLRELLEREIGMDACRAALVEFVGQCNPAAADDSHHRAWDAATATKGAAPAGPFAAWPDEDRFPTLATDSGHDPDEGIEDASEVHEAPVEFEISLDEPESESPRPKRGAARGHDDEEDEDEGELFDFSNFDLSKNIGAFTPNVLRRIDPPVNLTPAPLDELDTAALAPPLMADAFAFAPSSDQADSASPHIVPAQATASATIGIEAQDDPPEPTTPAVAGLTDPPAAPAAGTMLPSDAAAGTVAMDGPSTFDWATLVPAAVSDRPIQLVAGIKPRESALFGTGPASPPVYGEVVAAPLTSDEPGTVSTSADGPAGERRRRHKKAGKAQKDKLRSAAKPEAASSSAAWLVAPEQQAKFEQVTPEPPSTLGAAVVQTPAAPALQLPLAAPVPGVTPNRPPIIPLAPIVVSPPPAPAPMPQFASPPAIKPTSAPRPPAGPPISMIDADEVFAPVKVKADPPSGYGSAGKLGRAGERPKPPRHVIEQPSEPLSLPVPVAEDVVLPAVRVFPWKLAIAVVVLVVIAVLIGRASLPGGALRKGVPESAAPLPPAEDDEPASGAPVTGTGQVVVNTEPTGARVTLDGKPVGVSPLTLDAISAGTHLVTVSAPSGSVKRTIRVVADHSITVDVPIFSGWVAVFAPFVVTITENSSTLGTNEQGRLLVAPGRHMLVLSNEALGFSTAQQVDVTAGDVAAIHLDPKGLANINAVPWAEVWWDGRKIGETPIANYSVPLGTQEFVFKNPQFGERRATATIRAGDAAALSVDFSKQP